MGIYIRVYPIFWRLYASMVYLYERHVLADALAWMCPKRVVV